MHGIVYPELTPLDIASIDADNLFQVDSCRSIQHITESFIRRRKIFTEAVVGAEEIEPQLSVGFPPSALGDISPQKDYLGAGQFQAQKYCDSRLNDLRVDFWTKVPISNEFAAAAISVYLENEHAILGFFDADLFLTNLIDHSLDYCSPFLVSSLLCLACVSPTASVWLPF
jgi:hypothetical protein